MSNEQKDDTTRFALSATEKVHTSLPIKTNLILEINIAGSDILIDLLPECSLLCMNGLRESKRLLLVLSNELLCGFYFFYLVTL